MLTQGLVVFLNTALVVYWPSVRNLEGMELGEQRRVHWLVMSMASAASAPLRHSVRARAARRVTISFRMLIIPPPSSPG